MRRRLRNTDDDLESVGEQLGDVRARIERLLVVKNLIGEWTPGARAEYVVLCEQERSLIRRQNELATVGL